MGQADAMSNSRPGQEVPSGRDPDGEAVPWHLRELLTAWFPCPVSTLALCLWLHWFELAYEVTVRLADMELTTAIQAQLGELVELLESPNFMSVRLQLLET